MKIKKEVHFLIRIDGKYLAYIKRNNSNVYDWDEEYLSKFEFYKKYSNFQKILIEDETNEKND